MTIRKDIIAAGLDENYLAHAGLKAGASLPGFLPAALGIPISFEASAPTSSLDLIQERSTKGARFSQVPFPVYRKASEGKTRKVGNDDAVVGYSPLYDDYSHFIEVYNKVTTLVTSMRSYYEPRQATSIIADMEMEDLKKVCMQRWKYPGWFLAESFSPTIKNTPYAPVFVRALTAVIKRIKRAVDPLIDSSSDVALMLADSDPPDTNSGFPLLASGADTHLARLAMLRALPSMNVSPQQWVNAYSALGTRLGGDEGFMFSSTVATRHGPTIKSAPLWVYNGLNSPYTKDTEAYSLYDRVRLVYMIPFPVNFVLGPIYMKLKSGRTNVLGLWHTPELQARYVTALRAQGSHSIEMDFSGMDTSMPPHLIELIIRILIQEGFPKWPLEVMFNILQRQGILFPDFFGGSDATYMTGTQPWKSGFKLTSEFDTLYGAATLLAVLETMEPGHIDAFTSGKFVFAELGDDILFTRKKPLDEDEFARLAFELAGATLKIKHGTTFLKMFLPLDPEVKELTRPLARLIQQTFYNEDRYDGTEGGSKPDAILRLGLESRMRLLNRHPDFDRWWPPIFDCLTLLGFIKRASPEYRAALKAGNAILDIGDDAAIRNFALQNRSYMASLADKAKFQPSAASLLAEFQALGVAVDNGPENAMIRKMYMDALQAPVTSAHIDALYASIPWLS